MMDPCVDLEDELYFLRDENERLEETVARLTTECERLTKGLWNKGEYVDQLNGVIRRQRIRISELEADVQRLRFVKDANVEAKEDLLEEVERLKGEVKELESYKADVWDAENFHAWRKMKREVERLKKVDDSQS